MLYAVLELFSQPFRFRRTIAFALFLPVSLLGHSVPVFPSSQGGLSLPARRVLDRLVAAAAERTHHVVRYESAYVRIPYPGGDVPASTGVCTDEVIRAYRAVGIDLQKEVHEDMATHLSAYPRKWNRARSGANSATDPNIDHRRVPNLMVFFARHGQSLPPSVNANDYRPGDLITWNLGGAITHIGIVVSEKSPQTGRCLIVHNIGRGPQMEDVLFNWKIIGHYRYAGRN
jgi:uncharacterized protein YijF (DUF1287 family)